LGHPEYKREPKCRATYMGLVNWGVGVLKDDRRAEQPLQGKDKKTDENHGVVFERVFRRRIRIGFPDGDIVVKV